MIVAMLTTIDNPHDPFDEYDAWFNYDLRARHDTPGLLARVAVTSHELSEKDFNVAIEQAIDELLELNPTGMLRKVTRVVEDP